VEGYEVRPSLTLRTAEIADAPALAELWTEHLRRGEPHDQLHDVVTVLERADADPDQRIVVAEYDGEVAGAVHLRASTVSSINLEPVVQALSPSVLPRHRRHGVGRMLMEAAVVFAEERGVGYVATAVAAGSRDANRFMARLALSPVATLRIAPTALFRSRIDATRKGARPSPRQLTQVVAVRRSMRRRAEQTGV
jgi:predicted N-acetyltransferase YhbS